mmetsp:Transcript_110542/g.345615  ORF Transcript_110542/g.345615 Transcript_110542/m.345615 type:complete len:243 (-) Transcript_110542:765-1493(-)
MHPDLCVPAQLLDPGQHACRHRAVQPRDAGDAGDEVPGLHLVGGHGGDAQWVRQVDRAGRRKAFDHWPRRAACGLPLHGAPGLRGSTAGWARPGALLPRPASLVALDLLVLEAVAVQQRPALELVLELNDGAICLAGVVPTAPGVTCWPPLHLRVVRTLTSLLNLAHSSHGGRHAPPGRPGPAAVEQGAPERLRDHGQGQELVTDAVHKHLAACCGWQLHAHHAALLERLRHDLQREQDLVD